MAKPSSRTRRSATLGPSSLAVHAGEGSDASGSINVPVHLSSTFLYPELADGSPSHHIYSRYDNPSVSAVESKLAALEGAKGSLLFSSGMAATSTACLALLRPGDTVVVQQGVYGGTSALLRDELSRFGIKVVTTSDPVTPPRVPKKTRLVWMESVTNPLLRVADVPAWAEGAHDAGALLAVDNTFASPALQRPLLLGADLAMQSGTKYLGGHADLLAGALSWGPSFAHADDLRRARRNWGPTLDPHAAYLLGRGMKTLGVRIPRHCANAMSLAQAAQEFPGVRHVHYPGLPDHQDHDTAKRVLDGFGGMVALDLGSKAKAVLFRRKVRLIRPAASLGGVESLVSLPLESSHSYTPATQRRSEGVADGLVRISVGIEDAEDLVADVRQALQ